MSSNSLDVPRPVASVQHVDFALLGRQSLVPEQVPAPIQWAEFRGAAAIEGLSAILPQSDIVNDPSDHLRANDNVVTKWSKEARSLMKHASMPLLAAGRLVQLHRLDGYVLLISIFVLSFTCSRSVHAVSRTLPALPPRPVRLVNEATAACPAGKWMHAGGSCLDCSVVQSVYQEQLCPCEANRDAVITCRRGIDHRVMDCQQYDSGVAECWSRQGFSSEHNKSLTFKGTTVFSSTFSHGLEPRISQEHVEYTSTTTFSSTTDSAKSVMETPTKTTKSSDATSGLIATEVVIALIVAVSIYFVCRRNKFSCEVNRYAVLLLRKEDCTTLDREMSKLCTSLPEDEQEANDVFSAPRRPVPDVALLAVEIEAAVMADGKAMAREAAATEMTIVQVEPEEAVTAEMTTAK